MEQQPNQPKNNSHHEHVLLILAVAIAAIIGSASTIFITTFFVNSSQKTVAQLAVPISEQKVAERISGMIEEEQATIAVVQEVVPGVVNVVVKRPRVPDQFIRNSASLDQQAKGDLVEVGGGTGFLVSSDGFIITNKHVVDDPEADYYVILDDGRELPATVVALDVFYDLAILDIEGDNFQALNFGDSDKIKVGQTVIAIGNSLTAYQNTVTKGVVSGINRRVATGGYFGYPEIIEHAIQTDAAINPGNSGGPLINLLGEVVGVNTAISFEGEAIGFAIPSNDAKRIFNDIQEFGRIVRPWLGVRYQVVTQGLAQELALASENGALVISGKDGVSVFPGSPAEVAGLQEQDIIIAVNNDQLNIEHSLSQAIAKYRPGDEITLTVLRGQETLTLKVSLAELDPNQL